MSKLGLVPKTKKKKQKIYHKVPLHMQANVMSQARMKKIKMSSLIPPISSIPEDKPRTYRLKKEHDLINAQ